MKLLFIFGDSAVGKMTVGQEVCKATGMRLMHNHLTIEPVVELFGYYKGDTIKKVREICLEDFAQSGLHGLVFTYQMACGAPEEWEYVAHVIDIFKRVDADIYICELVAPLSVRLERNLTENRLKHKPSKRDTERSTALMLMDSCGTRIESLDGEFQERFGDIGYIKIDNTSLSAETVAGMLRERFALDYTERH
jgi:hypothetical protein